MFTKEDLQSIQGLVNRASISGQEAYPVALIQQKIINALDGLESEGKKQEKKDEKAK